MLASQRCDVMVNGQEAKAIQRDGFRNNRIVLLDLKPLLVAGENVVTMDVSSHTEKAMNDTERKKYPASAMHLNPRSGLAFYARCELSSGKLMQLGTDESWRVRRNPDGAWNDLADLPTRTGRRRCRSGEAETPIDEGPGLQPITRKDFANQPVDLGPQLSPSASTVAHAGKIRASLLAADPLQVALDRPNREVVIPVRATSRHDACRRSN